MIILVNGLPLFSKRLVSDLQSMDSKNKYFFFDTYNSKFAQLRFLFMLPFAGLVISMNGVTDKSGSLDWVIRLKKRLVIQWMGTDVQIALNRFKNKTILRKYIDYAEHHVDAEWLKNELEEIGLLPTLTKFKFGDFTVSPVEKFSGLSVVSYIPQKRQDYYGMDKICELAKKFPNVSFNIYGIKNSDYPTSSNLVCHNWQPEPTFREALRNSCIYMRLTEHDGFSATVIEALSNGSEVLWSFPTSHTFLATDSDQAEREFKKIIEQVIIRDLEPSIENIEFIKINFDKEKVMNEYIKNVIRK